MRVTAYWGKGNNLNTVSKLTLIPGDPASTVEHQSTGLWWLVINGVLALAISRWFQGVPEHSLRMSNWNRHTLQLVEPSH